MRSMNFHSLYKQKLQEKITEKKDRADRIKEQQQRIADMCGTVRTIDPFRGGGPGSLTATHKRTQSVNIEF